MTHEKEVLKQLRETNELLMVLAAALVYAMDDSPFRYELYAKLERIKERHKTPPPTPPLPPIETVTE